MLPDRASMRQMWKVPVPPRLRTVSPRAFSAQAFIIAQQAAALNAEFSTARNAPRRELSMQPVPVTLDIQAVPPFTS